MSKTRKVKKLKLTGNDFKRARRKVEGLYYLRLNEGNVAGQLRRFYRGMLPANDLQAVEFQLANTPCFWHCVSISYFMDDWGKRYRRWGFAKTNDTLKIYQQPLDPVLKAAQDEAERDANLKHLYARGFILAPWSKRHQDLYPLVEKHAKTLSLTDSDLADIRDYLKEDVVYYEFDPNQTVAPVERLDLDRMIARQLDAMEP